MIQVYGRHSGRESSHVNLNKRQVFDQKTNSDPKEPNITSFVVVLLVPCLFGTRAVLDTIWHTSANLRRALELIVWTWGVLPFGHGHSAAGDLPLPLPLPPGIRTQCPLCSWRTNYFDSTPLCLLRLALLGAGVNLQGRQKIHFWNRLYLVISYCDPFHVMLNNRVNSKTNHVNPLTADSGYNDLEAHFKPMKFIFK